MVYQEKYNKFLYNGYLTIQALTNKVSLFDEKYKISHKRKIIQEDIIGVSKVLYEEFIPSLELLKSKYKYHKNLAPQYLSSLTKSLEKFTTHTNTTRFMTIGLTFFMLSMVKSDNSNLYNIGQDNVELPIVKILPPQFMRSIFHSKIDAFTKLLGMTEGKANFFYKDNLGVATAYGWNPTKNSVEFNTDIAHKIGMSTAQVKSIVKISDNSQIQSVPVSLKHVILSDKQVQKSAQIMLVFYEGEFLKVMKIKAGQNGKDYNQLLKSYRELPNNQQAVMVHMAYKLGSNNLLKYDQFFKQLFSYMEQPSNINLIKVTNNFDYSYKTKSGTRLHDTRVEQTHNKFFNECGITDSERKYKDAIKKQVSSCHKLVASKTIKITNKG